MNTIDNVKVEVIRSFLNSYHPGYEVKGSTPYDKGCSIYKIDSSKIIISQQWNSNKDCWKEISHPNWRPKQKCGFFDLDSTGKIDYFVIGWNVIKGCSRTISENLRMVTPIQEVKEFDKFMNNLLKRYNK